MKANPQAGDWDFDGAYCPGNGHLHMARTFSVGIFQWLPKSRGRGVKRGTVVKRIRGYVSNPEAVYAEAERWIELHRSIKP